MGAGYKLNLPFEPRLAFAAKDGSFTANLEQCNGCGGCLKQTPTMCPTFWPPARKSCPRAAGPTPFARRWNCAESRRPAASHGTGSGAEQLPVLQGLHHGMPVQCEPGAAQGGTAPRAHPPRRLDAARTAVQFGGPVGPAGLRDAAPGQCSPGILSRSRCIGNRLLGFAARAPVAAVCATDGSTIGSPNIRRPRPRPRPGHPLGRHLCALSRTAHRHGRRGRARSGGF